MRCAMPGACTRKSFPGCRCALPQCVQAVARCALTAGPALQVATQIVASLLALETLSETEDIKMYINSPGAHPTPHALHAPVRPSPACTAVSPV